MFNPVEASSSQDAFFNTRATSILTCVFVKKKSMGNISTLAQPPNLLAMRTGLNYWFLRGNMAALSGTRQSGVDCLASITFPYRVAAISGQSLSLSSTQPILVRPPFH